MPSSSSLVARLRIDYPKLYFKEGEVFQWSPGENTIFYSPNGNVCNLLHELAHALLGHKDYTKDILLLEMERDAWSRARVLADSHNIELDEDEIQDALDTYRDWLHARSRCPECEATGIQVKKSLYRCFVCTTNWHVNDARACALRRYRLTKNTP